MKRVINWSYPVNVCALLADVPRGLVFSCASFHLEECRVLTLVGKTSFEAGEDSLGIQTAGCGCHFCEFKWMSEMGMKRL
jgi:hypothetical protein